MNTAFSVLVLQREGSIQTIYDMQFCVLKRNWTGCFFLLLFCSHNIYEYINNNTAPYTEQNTNSHVCKQNRVLKNVFIIIMV